MDSSQPGLPPPPGVIPNFQDAYTLHSFHAMTIAQCIIITTLAVSARLYTKQFVIKKRNWEDYTCFIGWLAFMIFVALEWCVGDRGGGTHQWNLYMADVQYNRRLSNINDVIYSISLLATKLSLLLLILRVFCTVQRDLFYWLTLFLIVLNSLFYTLFFFIPIFQCTPRRKIWDQGTPGRCLNVIGLYYASAVFNTFSDIAMLSVPIYLVWNLQMSIRRKVGISFIFCTGGLACIASILRLATIVRLARTKDYTYVKAQCAMWAEAEITGGLICSCIVVLPRFFQDVLRVVPYSYPAPSRGKWVQMDGRKKSVPAGWDESRGERALDEAVQGVTARPMEGV
ncbi:ribosomal protein L36 [Xanthoria calcicola]